MWLELNGSSIPMGLKRSGARQMLGNVQGSSPGQEQSSAELPAARHTSLCLRSLLGLTVLLNHSMGLVRKLHFSGHQNEISAFRSGKRLLRLRHQWPSGSFLSLSVFQTHFYDRCRCQRLWFGGSIDTRTQKTSQGGALLQH